MSLIPNNVWFGTENDMRWVPAPLPNYTPAQVRWRAKDQYLNGGAGVRQSTASHKELSLSWPVQSQEDLAPLVSYLQQAGPYFYLDPLNAEANAVPAYWSMPGLVQDGPLLIPGVAPSYVPTVGGRTLGYPTTSAVYTVEGTPNPNDTIRNYITNPEFKNTSGTVEVFRNRVNMPSGRIGSGWGGVHTSGCIYTQSTANLTNNILGCNTAFSRDFTKIVGGYVAVYASSTIPVNPGDIVSVGMVCRLTGPDADKFTLSAALVTRNGSTFVGWNDDRNKIISMDDGWFFTYQTIVIPESGVTGIQNAAIWRAPTAQEYIAEYQATASIVSINEKEIKGPEDFFSGDFSQDSDLIPQWTGTANNSESVLLGNVPSGVNPYQRAILISSKTLVDNYPSLRIISTKSGAGINSATGARFPYPNSIGSARSGMGVVYAPEWTRGTTDFRIGTPVSDYPERPVWSEELNIAKINRTASGFDTTGTGYISFDSWGYPGRERPDIWVSKPGVFPPDYTGPWFDGDSDPFLYNGKIYVPSWVGTPHNSQSIATAYEGNANTRIRIPVPSGYTLHVGLHGSGPGIAVGGVTAPAIPLTSTERTNLQYSTPGIATIQLLPGTHVISGIIAQVLPTGAEVPRGGFIPGMGHSQLVLDGDPTVTHYSVGIANAQTGIAADFVEVGAWL